jgi:putative glycosyltransferase (TIGR04348 family)
MSRQVRNQVVIVSPALADANNGNWQTARRWQRMLSATHSARIVREWTGADPAAAHDDVMLALHARRSAASIQAWAAERGVGSLAVVLTGTDLYRDIASDASAQRSLALAGQLVVLQALGSHALPEALRHKARVMFQSTSSRQTLAKPLRGLRAVMVGHLRDEKDPLTLMAAAQAVPAGAGIRIDHVGAPLDAALGQAAQATAQACPHYRWLGAQPHETTRRRIQRAHVLVHTSRMEGGAHVVMEAVCSGTPVLASRIDGNVGMLGADYAGYFEPGNAAQLAQLLQQARATQHQADGLLARLATQCALRAPLFAPEAEQQALLNLVADLGRQP